RSSSAAGSDNRFAYGRYFPQDDPYCIGRPVLIAQPTSAVPPAFMARCTRCRAEAGQAPEDSLPGGAISGGQEARAL
ncbi:MAG: hypothetical protein KA246_07600, partial [Alistipes sp.]|nr:hypothetical protein [Alistipes sp.]